MTPRDHYLPHLASRIQRLLAVQDRAEQEGDQEALRRVGTTMATITEMDGCRGRDDDL